MSIADLEPDPASVYPDRFTGRYRFFDDGWTGTLRLRHEGNGELRGQFASDRFKATYEVTGDVDHDAPHRMVFSIHNYNDLVRQDYHGHIFTPSAKAITGKSTSQGEPFAFFAIRSVRLDLPAYRRGSAVPQDFVGSYSLYVDGRPGTLHLEFDHTAGLRGTCEFRGVARPLPARAEVSTDVPYEVSIHVGEDAPVGGDPEHHLVLRGHLFTRPKSAVAGSALWRGLTLGFFMVRFR